ncbi:hypothetical protein J2D69_16000 [Lysinibacillus sphaericus]|uniref:Replication-associated protein ORF2/G2P domain-containing protein n=3 Tax=Lysinibacillus TaxID=400634 RepID=W7S5M3_LYSSH|nr:MULTISPECIES: hypothetical protein [Lysinibacillus]MBE5082950.1 hypothetical protein [Bacillus thuringiensis]ACA41262.1 conserved hypothetical protein [Lysinibacillus sphaericus C3-41]AMO32827.1 hypothetical protein AR327_10455 [Lysinibacillus sphaericus]AMR92069.1 hypothetical protein A1T07_18750 [Lysinibacillus sphaericus]ANA46117.1 hypothetical protein A2J09_11420 [Lysinibacillus sphaericus]
MKNKQHKVKHVLAAYEDAFVETELTKMHEDSLLDRAIAGYRVKSIWCGSVLEVEAYPYWEIPQKKRVKTDKNSSKAQEKLNEKNRQKHVVRLLNTNFRPFHDLYMTYTYSDKHVPKDYEQAKKDMSNLIKRMKYWLKKQEKYADFELKYLYTTEHTRNGQKVRAHHHMVTNFPDREVAEELWNSGRARSERLVDDDLGFKKLGEYLVKEKGEKTRKGYTPSRNLDKHTKVTVSDTKLTRRRAAKIATEEIGAQEIFEKMYKNYQFKQMNVSFSDYVSGAYLYVQMKRIDRSVKRKVNSGGDKDGEEGSSH